MLKKKEEYCGLRRGKKSIWEMAEYLNRLVDESDPDTDLSQIEHLQQTSEGFAGMATRAGSFSLALCTIWEKCSA